MNSFFLVLAATLFASISQVEGLPDEAPHSGAVITIDVATNTLYLFKDAQLVAKSPVATGKEKILRKGDKVWAFHTPRGHLKVVRKMVDPIWKKPDWAYIEDGEPIPPSKGSYRGRWPCVVDARRRV